MQFLPLIKSVIIVTALLLVGPAKAGDITTAEVEKYIHQLTAKYNMLTVDNFKMVEAEEALTKFKGSQEYPAITLLPKWVDVRKLEAKLLFKMIGLIKMKLKEPFDRTYQPRWNVLPPEGSGYGRSVKPSTIKDKKVREEYQRSIDDNSRKTKIYNNKSRLHRGHSFFFKKSEMHIGYLYALPPFSNELDVLLLEGKIDDAMGGRMLKRAKYNREKLAQ